MNSDPDTLIKSLVELGKLLKSAAYNKALIVAMGEARKENPWYTHDHILLALRAWGHSLEEDKIARWLDAYPGLKQERPQKTIGLVLAGNIPMAGFHDLLCCLVSGHKVIARQSSDDRQLLPAVISLLEQLNPGLTDKVTFTDDRLQGFEAIIATGSNNTSRYFEYYFGKHPNIIRKNRNGAGVIIGNESRDDLQKLGEDIFIHFGLGCRNISKLYIPENYDFTTMLEAFEPFRETGDHHKYRNNYDYQKSIFLINSIPFTDNGFVLLKEDTALGSPLSVIHYEYYHDLDEINAMLLADKGHLQCVVSANPGVNQAIPPGTSQQPDLWDYADGVDTMEFLLDLE